MKLRLNTEALVDLFVLTLYATVCTVYVQCCIWFLAYSATSL